VNEERISESDNSDDSFTARAIEEYSRSIKESDL